MGCGVKKIELRQFSKSLGSTVLKNKNKASINLDILF